MAEKPGNNPLIQKIEALEKQLQERQRAEEVLREYHKRYERLVNTIPCALYDYVRWPDNRSRFIYISPQCKRIFELEAEKIMDNGYLLWNMVVPEDLERLQQEDQAANQAREMFQSEVRIITKSGRKKWIQQGLIKSRQSLLPRMPPDQKQIDPEAHPPGRLAAENAAMATR